MSPPDDVAGTHHPFVVSPAELLDVSAGMAHLPADLDGEPTDVPLVAIGLADHDGGTRTVGLLLDDAAKLFMGLGRCLFAHRQAGHLPGNL